MLEFTNVGRICLLFLCCQTKTSTGESTLHIDSWMKQLFLLSIEIPPLEALNCKQK